MSTVGIVVTSHGNIGYEMIRTVDNIVPHTMPFEIANFKENKSLQERQNKLREAIRKADHGSGVLILCDMAGATPCNVCRSFLTDGRVAMVTGYNLPMLIKLASLENTYGRPEELAHFIQKYGQRNITVEEKTA